MTVARGRLDLNRRVAGAAAAATVAGGATIVLLPQHAASIARLFATAVAVVAGALVLAAVGRVVAQEPPRTALDAPRTAGAPPLDPHGLRDARRDLDRPAPPDALPPPVRERLLATAVLHLRRLGLDPHDPADRAAIGDRLGRETWQLFTAAPAAPTRRDRDAAAAAVHRTLDELMLLDHLPGAADHGRR